ncbi:hypothetical protein [Albimonas pacifica]|nr:hypothetical protein [Albimonas pacifica]
MLRRVKGIAAAQHSRRLHGGPARGFRESGFGDLNLPRSMLPSFVKRSHE